MEAKDILKQAKALIEDPDHWIKGWFARDLHGEDVDPISPHSYQYCSSGALMAAYELLGQEAPQLYGEAFKLLAEAMPPAPPGKARVVYFNDLATTRHADVMAVFAKAIQKAGG